MVASVAPTSLKRYRRSTMPFRLGDVSRDQLMPPTTADRGRAIDGAGAQASRYKSLGKVPRGRECRADRYPELRPSKEHYLKSSLWSRLGLRILLRLVARLLLH